MGLDLRSADKSGNPDYKSGVHAHWSYGSFSLLREQLAEAESLTLDAAEKHSWRKPWKNARSSLAPLLRHSDYDGKLTAADCARVTPRLKEVYGTWATDDNPQACASDSLLDLIAILSYCADHGVAAVFT